MDEPLIRRYLTSSRRFVLDVIGDSRGSTMDEIAQLWLESSPAVRTRDAARGVVAQVLWRLENLGWVERVGDNYRLTALGERARNVRGSAS